MHKKIDILVMHALSKREKETVQWLIIKNWYLSKSALQFEF